MLKLFSNAVDFFFPKICLISDAKIPGNNSNPFVLDEIIDNLDTPTAQDIYLLKYNIHSNNMYVKYATFGKNNVNTILHFLKYKGYFKLGLFFGEMLAKELLTEYPGIVTKYSYITPVPLHKTKHRERGYNQSEFLALGINIILKLKYEPNLVRRIRYTKSQTFLPFSERITNVKDAFKINPQFSDDIKGKRIILVDDVITTGSTINEVIKTLKEAKVPNIFVVSLSMAKSE